MRNRTVIKRGVIAVLGAVAVTSGVCRPAWGQDEPAPAVIDTLPPQTPILDSAAVSEPQPEVEPAWYTDLTEAQQKATTSDRQILYFVFTDWCRWCRAMEDSVLGTPTVDSLRGKLVLARVNGDIDTALVSRLRIQGYPTILMLDKTGNEIDRILGYRSAAALARWCRDALNGEGTMWTLEKEHREKRNDPKVMFALARKHLGRGQFEEAQNFLENIVNQDLGNTSGKVDSAMFEVAMIHRHRKDWYKAIEKLKELNELYPESALREEIGLYIPWLLSRAGDRDEAIKLYENFLDKHSGSSEAGWVRDQIQWLTSLDEGKS